VLCSASNEILFRAVIAMPSKHQLAILKAGLNLVPGVGGTIASLIDDYVPSAQEAAQKQFNGLFEAKLSELEGRINVEVVNKDDFAELFTKIEVLTSKSNRELKLRAAANLLANFFLKPGDPAKVPFDELDHFAHCLERLSSGAIAILGASRRLGLSDPSRGSRSFSFPELPKLLGGDPDLIMSLVSELGGLNLLHVTEGQIPEFHRQHISILVTTVGDRFAERFIEGKM